MSRRSHSMHFSTRISGRSPTRGIVVNRANDRPQVGPGRRSFITYRACYRRLTFECGRKGLRSPRARRAGALYSTSSSMDEQHLRHVECSLYFAAARPRNIAPCRRRRRTNIEDAAVGNARPTRSLPFRRAAPAAEFRRTISRFRRLECVAPLACAIALPLVLAGCGESVEPASDVARRGKLVKTCPNLRALHLARQTLRQGRRAVSASRADEPQFVRHHHTL
jgi:hypothetical protein